ncbi:MAG: hypothetical protein IJH38_09680 [Clostridia bacterium]|nr:hypothetical protein [Clostridia bacterium]
MNGSQKRSGWARRFLPVVLFCLLFGVASVCGTSAELTIEPGEGEELAPDLLGPQDLVGEATAPPTAAPGATEAPEEIPWLSSWNYPRAKTDFENEIWAILTGKWGLEAHQAAGLMGSIQAESGFCPYNVQGTGRADDRGRYRYRTGDSVGFGLCQWTSSGRKEALRRHAAAHGSEDLVWDFDIQMGYMGSEMDLATLRSTQTLYEAAEWATLWYERPDQRNAGAWPGVRYEKGREIYARHTGHAYREPALRFSLAFNGRELTDGETCPLTLGGSDALTVHSNYYWRLVRDETPEAGWLEIDCASLYRKDRQEPCVCGYVCDGRKRLTLIPRRVPVFGGTARSTLRFEIFRGERVEKTVTLTLTWSVLEALKGILK